MRGARGARSGGNRNLGRNAPQYRKSRHLLDYRQQIPPYVSGYRVLLTGTPANGYRTSDLLPQVQFLPQASTAPTMDVQVQWAHDRTFASVLQNFIITAATSNQVLSTPPAAPLDVYSWYIRARGGHASTGPTDPAIWSAWSSVLYIEILPIYGSSALYIDQNIGQGNILPVEQGFFVDQNVGRASATVPYVAAYADENVGVRSLTILETATYVDQNVGPNIVVHPFTAAYVDQNVDPTVHPTPRIWWIHPEQAKEGWIFHLFGHGFGDVQGSYDGEVLLNELVCTVTTWERIAAAGPYNWLSLTIQMPNATSTGNNTFDQTIAAPAVAVPLVTGDQLVWQEYWESPASANLGVALDFLLNSGTHLALSAYNDDDGNPLHVGTNQPLAYGQWLSRTFTVPSALNGRSLQAVHAYAQATAASQVSTDAVVRYQQVGVLDSGGNAKWWAVSPSVSSFPALPAPTLAQGGSQLLASTVGTNAQVVFAEGTAVDNQVIVPEHGHIAVTVPTGARSGLVKVRLQS